MTFDNSFSLLDSTFLLFSLVPFIAFILGVILFFKIWFACNDIAALRRDDTKVYDLDQDLQFWARAKYESDKRLGVIIEADMSKAEDYVNRKNDN